MNNNDVVKEPREYFKLKFDGILSDYHFMIIVKLSIYIKEFHTNADNLEKYWKDFNIPLPANKISFPDMYTKMVSCEYLKLQDSTGKYLYGPSAELKLYVSSLMVNLYQQALSKTLWDLSLYLRRGELNEDIRQIAECLYQNVCGLTTWIALPLFNYYADYDNLTIDDAYICRPNSHFYSYGRSFVNLINTYLTMYVNDYNIEGRDKTCLCEALLTSCVFMRGLCAFTCLCGFLNDATVTNNFHEALNEIALYFMVRYHNSILYRMEIATSPLDVEVPVELRGCKEHTTRIKIYLFDKDMIPNLIRIDMPHKGEPHLHFNVRTATKRECVENHRVIAVDLHGIESALNGIQDAIVNICPNLFKWVDSTKDDDDIILNNMLLLKALDVVSHDYLAGIWDEDHLTQLSEVADNKFTSQTDAIFECCLHFASEF